MAKDKILGTTDPEQIMEYTPGIPGIVKPLVVPEGGHEGARAVSEYRGMAEGRMTRSDAPSAKFRDYDDDFQISTNV